MVKTDIWKKRALIGCAVGIGSPRIAELAGRLGFDAVWIEMEHASTDLVTAEQMCVATEAGGAIPIVRTAGYHREHILHALEIGGRIIVAPLVNDAETAREVVKHGKFRPLGQRGFNSRSRGLEFGLDMPGMLRRANDETHLMPQIETVEAVNNLDKILDAAIAAGADLLIVASDYKALIEAWRGQLDRLHGTASNIVS